MACLSEIREQSRGLPFERATATFPVMDKSRARKMAERIRSLRIQKGLTQQGLADATKCSQKSISNWENASLGSEASTRLLTPLVDFFHVSIAYLLGIKDIGRIPEPGDTLVDVELIDKMAELVDRGDVTPSDIKKLGFQSVDWVVPDGVTLYSAGDPKIDEELGRYARLEKLLETGKSDSANG